MYRPDPRCAPAPRAVLHTGWQAVASQLPDGPAVVAIERPREQGRGLARWLTLRFQRLRRCPAADAIARARRPFQQIQQVELLEIFIPVTL